MMSAPVAFRVGLLACIAGLAFAAYLVDVPLAWVVVAGAAALGVLAALMRRHARRASGTR